MWQLRHRTVQRFALLWLLPLLCVVLVKQAIANEPAPITILEHKDGVIKLLFTSGAWHLSEAEDGESRIEMPLLAYESTLLPQHKALLGVPDVSIQQHIIESDSRLVAIERLSLPESLPLLVTLEKGAKLRDQSAVAVTFNPVQVEEEQIRIYTEVVVELRWDPLAQEQPMRPNHPTYEQVLENSLLNYPFLDRPRPRAAVPAHIVRTFDVTPTVRMEVEEVGLYQLTFFDLAAIGFPISMTHPNDVQVQHRGVPIATHMIGGDDGSFDDGDSLLFFAEAYEDEFTDRNVYWLTVGTRLVMDVSAENHQNAPLATQFNTTTHLEEDSYYWISMPDGDDQNLWFWGERLSPNASGLEPQRTITFVLPTLASTPTATIYAQLKGYTSLAHHSKLYLNNTLIDTQDWAGQELYTHTVVVTGSLLVQGANVLTVEAADSGANVVITQASSRHLTLN